MSTFTARIIASHGRHYVARDNSGALWHCIARGKKHEVAVNDCVILTDLGNSGDVTQPQAVIEKIEPRQNLFRRSDQFKDKAIAANVTQVWFVVATEPSFDPELLSRCQVACAAEAIQFTILLNKADLAALLARAEALIAPFQAIGIPVIHTSTLNGQGIDQLRHQIIGQSTVLTGQSGMGKSSLINELVPDAKATIGEISHYLDTGRHTTTTVQAYQQGPETTIIDVPGLQVFGLSHLTDEQILLAFPEFRPHLGDCRFRDCRHDQDPGCALRAAVENGSATDVRLQLLRRLLQDIR
ncbi:ribosome small subunit-dependent GTPase A [Fluviibacter phosphoraccumulans]|uniref:Small ribosomal subunit biogenesis GTPase RsgA n=1 Tax=Fluviibacter phosphoraccumulans TaxID=1751046 RepID=A0A7R6R5V5_9RHOO|nr:ribosome small subunit-dependent GTPase A [Fluviibacter phosphoraccumulans]BBU69734.1 putative ribosome biogenesis GTPase RsgA [Fluviibacter phosphoraccumulans]BBU71083.1 putative ribosome biogenesis GTPase RsgA [Fluviibacter phosphoraccumulans]